MPGVVVTTAVRTGPTNAQVMPTATLFVAGVTVRGPEGKAIAVSSIAEFEAVYGGYTSDGWVNQTLENSLKRVARALMFRALSQMMHSMQLSNSTMQRRTLAWCLLLPVKVHGRTLVA